MLLAELEAVLLARDSLKPPVCELFSACLWKRWVTYPILYFHWRSQNLTSQQQEGQNIEHLLGIFASLLRLLPGGSAPRIRTLAKFMEKDYEKIEKLVKLRREYAARVSPVEQAINKERKSFSKDDQEYMAGEWLSRRLDAGLFSLQVRIDLYFRGCLGLVLIVWTDYWCYPGMADCRGWRR